MVVAFLHTNSSGGLQRRAKTRKLSLHLLPNEMWSYCLQEGERKWEERRVRGKESSFAPRRTIYHRSNLVDRVLRIVM